MYEASFTVADGYEVQLMVLLDYPGGRQRRGLKMSIYRSRVWIGRQDETDPLIHRSQEQTDLKLAIDMCYSMTLAGARLVVDSPLALAMIEDAVDAHFGGGRKAI